MSAPEPPLVFLLAGEPSGDNLGVQLMRALARLAEGEVRFAGVGGEQMEAEGLDSLFPMAELAVMGLVEVLPRALKIMRRIDQTVSAVEKMRPAVVVTIDSPGFTYRVAHRLRRRGVDIPLVHYVAPQVWAWRPHRARTTAQLFDRLMTLLPFEPPFFEREGLATTHVGHPAIEATGRGDGVAFRARHGIPAEARVLAVLPGSRRGEVARLLPVFADAAARLAKGRPDLRVVVPTVATVAREVAAALRGWAVPAMAVAPGEKHDAFTAADAAMAASGTVTLELSIADVPFVTAYRVNPVTAAMVRRALSVRFATLSNVILDREAVPELLQERCRAENLAAAVARLLDDEAARAAQRAAFAEVRRLLGSNGVPPSERAARVVLEAMGN